MFKSTAIRLLAENPFKLRSKSLNADKRVLPEPKDDPDLEKSDEEVLLEVWKGIPARITNPDFAQYLLKHNCFMVFKENKNVATGKDGPGLANGAQDAVVTEHTENNSLYSQLVTKYAKSIVIDDPELDRSRFDAQFDRSSLPRDEKLIVQFITVKNVAIIPRLIFTSNQFNYDLGLIGLKVSEKSSLHALKNLKPFLEDFSERYKSISYESLLEIATSRSKHNYKKIEYLLRSLGQFGVIKPDLLQNTFPPNSSWIVFRK